MQIPLDFILSASNKLTNTLHLIIDSLLNRDWNSEAIDLFLGFGLCLKALQMEQELIGKLVALKSRHLFIIKCTLLY